ncbi:MAG: glycosyltransferase family 4 protein [Bryobacteraceae bacterium]|nr:glycosyltransferase family 4 protein [Bryobacteraceae bacterium]
MTSEFKPTRILLAGTFLSSHVGTRAPIEDLADRLESRGYNVIRTSSIRNGLLRGADVLTTTLRHRSRIDVAVVDLYSGRAFLWAEALGMLLQSVRIPFLYSMHGGALPEFAERQPSRVRQCLARAAAVHAPSRYLSERMKPYLDSAVILPNPLDLDQYPFRQRQHAKPNIIWVRRLHKIYNPALAPAVVSLLATEWPDVTLTMVGRDEHDGSAAETMRVAETHGVASRIRFTGAVARSEVAALLNAADIFLNTSDIDNTPVSVMEAMARGLCVVSTDPGGVPYLVRSGRDGLLAPCGDAPALAGHIDTVLRRPDLAHSLSANARRTVEASDWSAVLPAWERLLHTVFQTRTPSRATQTVTAAS